MPWTTITKPPAGRATWKSLIDAIIDNLSTLHSSIESVADVSLPNPSFEQDSDADNRPDEWTFTAKQNGSGTLTSATADHVHGGKAWKFTRALGVANGGGTLETTDYFTVSEKRPLELQWTHKCTAAGLHDLVQVKFYDKDRALISTVTAYDSVANPTSWTIQSASITPPANARYAKIIITGGETDANVAGDSLWDDFKFQESSSRAPRTITAISSGNWTCPAHVTRIKVELWGGGGGGHSSGAGGGGGEYARAILTVVPGTVYALTIGQGGAAGANGTTTFFGGIINAVGGDAGSGGAGGAGGTGGTNGAGATSVWRINGSKGRNVISTFVGGEGGTGGGGGGAGGAGGNMSGGVGSAGVAPGGGGGGAATGAAGADGRIVIEY